jgi:hypothetical protein
MSIISGADENNISHILMGPLLSRNLVTHTIIHCYDVSIIDNLRSLNNNIIDD